MSSIETGNENRSRVLHYIDTYIRIHGYSPSLREVAEDCGLALATVHFHVGVLIDNDQLTMTRGLPRTMRLT